MVSCKICKTVLKRNVSANSEYIEINYFCKEDDYGKQYTATIDEVEHMANEEEYGI